MARSSLGLANQIIAFDDSPLCKRNLLANSDGQLIRNLRGQANPLYRPK
jgi:hypothetical protein